jgi:hypothetical protein
MKPYITIAAFGILALAGCSTTQQQQAQSNVAKVGTFLTQAETTINALEPIVNTIAVQTSGTNGAKVTKQLAAVEADITQGENDATLLQGVVAALPVTTGT